MNQIKDKNVRPVAAPRKITKNEIPEAIKLGITRATLANKGVNKRLKKQQEKIKRQQDLRENAIRLQNKAMEEAKKRMTPADNQNPKVLKDAVQKVVKDTVAAGLEEQHKKQEAMHLRVQAPDPEPSVAEIIANTPPVPGPAEEVHPMTFTDGTTDTNDDPKNFGRQSVDPELSVTPTRYEPNQCFDVAGINPFEGSGVSSRKQMYANVAPAFATLPPIPKLKDNEVLINLYGDDENYKPFPNIGDKVRLDGMTWAIRTLSGNAKPRESELTGLRQVDHVNDTIAHVPAGAIIMAEDIDVYEIKADEFTTLPEGFVLYDDSLPVTNLDAPGMEGAKEAFLKLAAGTADIGDSSQNMKEFRDAVASSVPHIAVIAETVNSFTDGDGNPISEVQALELLSKDITIRPDLQVTQENIQQSFPYHPQQDGPFSPAAFTEGVRGYKVQNSGISGMIPDPEVIQQAREAQNRVAEKLNFTHRPDHRFDPLLEEKKDDDSASDNSFSLNP